MTIYRRAQPGSLPWTAPGMGRDYARSGDYARLLRAQTAACFEARHRGSVGAWDVVGVFCETEDDVIEAIDMRGAVRRRMKWADVETAPPAQDERLDDAFRRAMRNVKADAREAGVTRDRREPRDPVKGALYRELAGTVGYGKGYWVTLARLGLTPWTLEYLMMSDRHPEQWEVLPGRDGDYLMRYRVKPLGRPPGVDTVSTGGVGCGV